MYSNQVMLFGRVYRQEAEKERKQAAARRSEQTTERERLKEEIRDPMLHRMTKRQMLSRARWRTTVQAVSLKGRKGMEQT